MFHRLTALDCLSRSGNCPHVADASPPKPWMKTIAAWFSFSVRCSISRGFWLLMVVLSDCSIPVVSASFLSGCTRLLYFAFLERFYVKQPNGDSVSGIVPFGELTPMA